MSWTPFILVYVVLGVGGLAVLAVMALRVLGAVRALGREVARSQQQLEPKLAAMEQASAARGDTAGPGHAPEHGQ